MGRRLIRVTLALTPIALLAHYVFDASSTVVFVLAAAALTPIAFLIGEATENVAFHTGSTVGALANASFGNAPELIIALVAIAHSLPDVVLGSIAGSIASTSLLVCGGAMVAAGDGDLARRSLLSQLRTTILAVVLFLFPSIPGLHGDPQRHTLYLITVPVASVLLCAYVAVTVVNLRRKRRPAKPMRDATWSLRVALATLAVATAATAFLSALLVDSLQSFGRSLGLSQLFVAAVIVALVGNAAEQGSAVVIAYHGNPRLGTEIAISSATQVAVFVCPAVALLSGLLGNPLALSFRPVELAAMGGGALAAAAAAARGRSSRAAGLALIGGYGVVVAAFALAPG